MTKFLSKVKALCIKLFKRFYTGRWYIKVHKCTKDGLEKRRDYIKIQPPENRFYADPFILKKNNLNYIFFEEYLYEESKGVISCVTLDLEGRIDNHRIVLEKDYHLSYPFLFEYGDDIYMIPETCENRAIELYKAENFPGTWILEKVMLDSVNAADATIIKHNNLFWMFVSIADENMDYNTDLHLYYSDNPLGDWVPHSKNPIVSDRVRARPAGNLFYKDGVLIRPGQDCKSCYGRAIWLNRIEVMNETEYREVPFKKIKASILSGDICTHTINFNEDYEVADYKAITRRDKRYGGKASL